MYFFIDLVNIVGLQNIEDNAGPSRKAAAARWFLWCKRLCNEKEMNMRCVRPSCQGQSESRLPARLSERKDGIFLTKCRKPKHRASGRQNEAVTYGC